MNGYSNNGFTQSLNGILSLTDGLGTTNKKGEIKTGDITGDDITSNTVTTITLKSKDFELTGDLIVDGLTNFNNISDASSLLSTASIIINGGVIIKENLYATDEMSNNIVSW